MIGPRFLACRFPKEELTPYGMKRFTYYGNPRNAAAHRLVNAHGGSRPVGLVEAHKSLPNSFIYPVARHDAQAVIDRLVEIEVAKHGPS